MAAPAISVTLDQKAMARADKRLAGYMGKPLQRRAQQAYIEGARLMVRPTRQQIRAAGLRKTGRFEKSVKARKPRLRSGEMAVASVGPVDAKRHLLVRGHRIVTPGGRDTGRRTVAHPVVDRAFAQVGQQALDFIATRTLAVTGSTYNPF
jgi:hypothetical protein